MPLPKLTPQNLHETIPAWCEAVHSYAREKGWWDEGITERNVPQMLLLVKSELIEAHEEHRRPESKLDEIYFGEGTPPKPEGFPIEVADAAIRIFDLAQALLSVTGMPARSQTLLQKASAAAKQLAQEEVAENVGEALDDAIMMIAKARSYSERVLYAGEDFARLSLVGSLIEVVGYLFAMATAFNFDLGHAIAMKHEYNATRPYRHGNKKA